MPKQKTKRGAAKRFKISGSGRVSHGRAKVRHNTGSKRSKWVRQQRGAKEVSQQDVKQVHDCLPYR